MMMTPLSISGLVQEQGVIGLGGVAKYQGGEGADTRLDDDDRRLHLLFALLDAAAALAP